MAVSKTQVLELLGSGLSNEVVATAVGCEPSYITQLLADETFANEVAGLRSAALLANNKRDRGIDRLEDNLLERLQDAIEGNLIYKPNELLRAFAVVNNAKRRGIPSHESLTVQQTVVNLTIPLRVVKNFTIDARGEVIDVDGQTLVTMPAQQLLRDLASRSDDDRRKYQKVAAFLPGTAIEHGSGE